MANYWIGFGSGLGFMNILIALTGRWIAKHPEFLVKRFMRSMRNKPVVFSYAKENHGPDTISRH